MDRRQFIQAGSAASVLGVAAGCASTGGGSGAGGNVVVVGGGYGGATAAKYVRMWSEGRVNVTLVEPNDSFISCPISNLVIGGSKQMADITTPYDNLAKRHGVKIIKDRAVSIDAGKRTITLAGGTVLPYDRLVLSPGIEFMWDALPGLKKPGAQDKVLHSWNAGPQTVALRRQLEAMPDGGVYALTIPLSPYRCPPGPYERACQVAHYFSKAKPKSKVLILDANEDVISKKGLFTKAWSELYPNIVEYRPNHELIDVDVTNTTALFEFDKVRADVLNVVPPQRAGAIASAAGLKLVNNRWVDVDWLSLESTNTPGIHVLGDAIFPAPTMPKSGHMANQHAKLAAAAILNLLAGEAPNPNPVVMNTCYSFLSSTEACHVASIHQYDAEKKTVLPVPGSGGVSAVRSVAEAQFALGWAKNIWADALA